MTTARRVLVLFEHGHNWRPFGSAYIRLLRPLMHPSLQAKLDVIPATDFVDESFDGVVIDRLWRPDVSISLARKLVERIRKRRAKIIYSLDDNYFAIPPDHMDRPSQERLEVVEFFLRQADAVWVTTDALKKDLSSFNEKVQVLPHALDERLLVPKSFDHALSGSSSRPKVIGYMGTLTHDDDLIMVLPALQEIWRKHSGQVVFEIIGAVGKPSTFQLLQELPVRWITPEAEEREYPLFMLWFTSRVRWDIAISPLVDTVFNRAKSDIKFLDYSAIATAGVFSPIPSYQATISHGETGWLAENQLGAWVQALDTLLTDDDLRLKISRNAYHGLHSRRTLAHCSINWLDALNQVLETII
jgi:glycosyltransferase involved in cell wall biosynthesis